MVVTGLLSQHKFSERHQLQSDMGWNMHASLYYVDCRINEN